SSKNQNFKPTIIDSSGIFDLTKLSTNEDTFLITFNTVNGSCWRSKDFAIPITNPFEPKITAVTSLCENISIVQLKSSLQGGLWSGTRILDTKNGIYNISGLTAGQSFVARIDSMGYCGGFATRKFYIDSVTDIYFTFNTGYKGPFCKGENVNVNFVGNPINDTNLYGEGIWKHAGNWLGNQQNQTFNPSNSSIKDGIFTSEYTFTNLNGCISSKSIKFIIY